MTSEDLLNQYLEQGQLSSLAIKEAIKKRELFPCYFGSALHLEGITTLLNGLDTYTKISPTSKDFGAYVYKISHDKTGQRLTHVKIISGSLAVKSSLTTAAGSEKVNEIRLYNGSNYQNVTSVSAGSLCVLTGLTKAVYGDTFGNAPKIPTPLLAPIMTYQVLPKDGTPIPKLFEQLKYFEAEDPVLHVLYKEKLAELQIQVMGEVRLEILKANMLSKFQTDIAFSTGSVLYKETITKEVIGFGHFEPLRHFSEVHLLLEPGVRGSGLVVSANLAEEELSANYQNQVINTLKSRELPGVLTGAPLTDLKITLIGGISHLKHTEGGDFLEATLRALRQGLMKTTSILLEPYVSFSIGLPSENLGRLLADLSELEASFTPPIIAGDMAQVTGSAPAINLGNYPSELASFTKGNGNITLTPLGYQRAHNEAEVLAASSYRPDEDLDFPAASVFCAKGKSFTLPWDQVDAHLKQVKREASSDDFFASSKETPNLEADLKAIFERTYGSWDRRPLPPEKKIHQQLKPTNNPKTRPKKKISQQKYLLVDGYNIVFAWPYLKTLAATNLDAAREVLIDILSNYQGFVDATLIVVFDAYKIKDHPEEILKYKGLNIVFTKEAETADAYIEKTVHEIGRTHDVTIATSDHLEQIIAYGQGGRILSANDLLQEISRAKEQMKEHLEETADNSKSYLLDHLNEDLKNILEKIIEPK